MRCRQLGRVFRDTVEASLSVLALSGVNTLTWATPENLTFLTRFKNVRTLHWCVRVCVCVSERGRGGGVWGGGQEERGVCVVFLRFLGCCHVGIFAGGLHGVAFSRSSHHQSAFFVAA